MKSIPITTVLQTERLQLRSISLSDIDLVWSISRIPGFNDGMAWEPPETKEELVTIAEKNLINWKDGKAFSFTIEIAETNLPMGRITIRRVDKDKPDIWNIGFWIHPDHWRLGYATEAAQAVINFGFNDLAASKITTAHAIWNTPSKKVIEKLGFQFMGINPCGFMKEGKSVPEYEYVIEIKKPGKTL
ncbi:MAG: GNAT family N-acetyltransferase [Methylococcales bacterium]|nr:GNAT family N-acetyltransferase [Methylococcales bacterium]